MKENKKNLVATILMSFALVFTTSCGEGEDANHVVSGEHDEKNCSDWIRMGTCTRRDCIINNAGNPIYIVEMDTGETWNCHDKASCQTMADEFRAYFQANCYE